MRVYDPSTKTWAIWWFDSRHPHDLDPPVVGGFRKGVGTFYADDHFNGKPIKAQDWVDVTGKIQFRKRQGREEYVAVLLVPGREQIRPIAPDTNPYVQ